MSTLIKNKSIKEKSKSVKEKSKSVKEKSKSVKEKSKIVKEKNKSIKNNVMNELINKYIKLLKNKKNEIPCVEAEYKNKKIDYRYYKKFINKLKSEKNIVNVKNKNVNKIEMCKINAYNKYLKQVPSKGLFMNLRKYHQNIKSNYIHKYAFNTDLLMDIGSSQLKSMRFWNSARIKKVVAMEPSLELFDLGMIYLRKDFYGRRHVTFLRGVGEKSWANGEGGLNDFASKYLMNIIKNNVKANVLTFEFTFHYMIYNIKTLMENIKSVSKSGTKVIIHCINGDFLMNVFKEKDKYEVLKDNNVVFYAEKDFEYKNKSASKIKSSSKSKELLDLKKVNIFFSGAQGLNNVIPEYLVIKEDIVKVFEKYGFKLVEFTPFSEQNHKDFGLEPYEFDVSKIYTSYVFEYL